MLKDAVNISLFHALIKAVEQYKFLSKFSKKNFTKTLMSSFVCWYEGKIRKYDFLVEILIKYDLPYFSCTNFISYYYYLHNCSILWNKSWFYILRREKRVRPQSSEKRKVLVLGFTLSLFHRISYDFVICCEVRRQWWWLL